MNVPCRVLLSDYVQACHQNLLSPFSALMPPEDAVAYPIACLAAAVGVLEPASATRPAACEPVSVFDKIVEAPPATLVNGKVVPSDVKLIKICAGLNQALVVHRLRGLPANLTAQESGEVVFKKLAVMGFSEGFCLPFEPGDGSGLGTYANVEHVILCPGSGFDLYGRNHDPFSNALFSIHAEVWATC